MSPPELARVLDSLGRPRILVLGDAASDGSPGPCVSLLRRLSADVTWAGTGGATAVEETNQIERIESLMPWHDAVVILDERGTCNRRILRAAIHAAGLVQIPTIVHPSDSAALEDYRGVTAIALNRAAAEHAAGLAIKKPAEALAAGRRLCWQAEASLAFLGLEGEGIVLAEGCGYSEFFAAHGRAGDDLDDAETLLATIALCLAEGTTSDQAARLACIAAGLGESLTRDGLAAEILAPRSAVLPIPEPLRRAG